MADKWVQLWVKAPAGNGYTSPQAIKRVDDHLIQEFFLSVFIVSLPPTNLPTQGKDGTYEVRVMVEALVAKVKEILTKNYGLEITKEVVN